MLRKSNFFELAGTLTVEVEFIVTEAESQQLIDLVQQENVCVFYSHTPARFGVINPDVNDQAADE